MTIFLRFPDELTAIACMDGWWFANQWAAPAHDDWAVDVVGTIYSGGEYDADGNELSAAVALPGWHLNIRGDVPERALPFLIDPVTPQRIFAESAD